MKRPLSPNDALLRMAIGSDTHFNAEATATVISVTSNPAQLYHLEISNSDNSTFAFIQIFDLATGSVTLGTTTPKLSFVLPGNGGADKFFNVPINFDTAISYAVTTTKDGLTAPTNNLVANIIFKDTP